MGRMMTIVTMAVLLTACTAEKEDTGRSTLLNFDRDQAAGQAKGFTVAVGTWRIHADEDAPSKPNTLGQDAANGKPTFNVILRDEAGAKDVDLSVHMKAVSGEIDRGGGLVWRAKDAKNYYVCRFNPLEDNYRVYKVVDGKRTQLGSADIKAPAGWHVLRATMKGDQIRCYMDGKERLAVQDATFPDAGKIGLWTKADARTRFDDLRAGAAAP